MWLESMKIRPTLIIGLGDSGSVVAEASHQQLISLSPTISDAVTAITLGLEGILRNPLDNAKILDLEIDQPEDGISYGDVRKKLIEQGKAIGNFLEEIYDRLVALKVAKGLLSAGIDLGEYQVILIAPLYDRVGSAAIIPFLKAIAKFSTDKGIRVDCHCIGILPDLDIPDEVMVGSSTSPAADWRSQAYSRTYAAMCELDAALSDSSSNLTASFFLLSNKNAEGVAIGTLAEVRETVGTYCGMLIRDEINALFGTAHLFEAAKGKDPHYGSFGLSSLTYPAEKFAAALRATSIKELLNILSAQVQKKSNRNELDSVVIDFLSGYDDNNLYSSISKKREQGELIYSDFDKYLGQKYPQEEHLEETNPQKYIEEVRLKSKDYYDHLFSGQYVPALTQRAADIKKSFIESIDAQQIGFVEDESGKKGVTYAHGFLSVLRGSESEYIEGDILGETRNLTLLEERELSFYKFKVEDDTKNVNRVEELETQMKNKESLLRRLREDLERTEKKLAGGKAIDFLITEGKFFNLDGKKIYVNGYKSGDKKDGLKDYDYSRISPDRMPSIVDLRPYMTKVEDQGEVGSCSANAVASAYEFLAKKNTGKLVDMSRLFIYYNARAVSGNQHEDCGSSLSDCARALQEEGACFEKNWPYDPTRVLEQPSPPAYDEAAKFKADDASRVPIDLQAMKHCLAEGYPFAFGLKIFAPFFDKADSRVPLPAPEEERDSHCGSHAMLCVGYSDKDHVFIVRNSWGEVWKDKGYCYIPYDYMINEDYCDDVIQIRSIDDRTEIDRKLVWKGEGSLFDEVVNDARLDSLKEAIKKGNDELSSIVEEYTPLKQKVEALNNQVRDANFRNDLINKEIHEQEEAIEKTEGLLTANEDELMATERRMDNLLTLRDKWMKRLIIYGPSMILAIILVTLALISHFTSVGRVLGLMFYHLGDALLLLGMIAVGYSLWGWRKYLTAVGNDLNQTRLSLKDLKNKKINILLQFKHQNSQKYTIRYEHIVHSYLIDLIRDVENWIDGRILDLDKFIAAILEFKGNEEKLLASVEFEESIFLNSVVSKEDLDSYKVNGNPYQEFFSERGKGKFGRYYVEFLKSKSIVTLQRDLDDFFSHSYRMLEMKSIYDMIFREDVIAGKCSPETRIKLLINAARPYIHVSEVGGVDVDTYDLHRWRSSGDESALIELFGKNGVKFNQIVDSMDRGTVTLLSIKNGVPAFYSNCLLECHSVYQQALRAGRMPNEFFSDPDYVNSSFLPFNIAYQNPHVIEALIQACALGVVRIDGDGFRSETAHIGANLNDSYEFLNSLAGEKELKILEEVVSPDRLHEMSRDEREKIPGMVAHFRKKYSKTLLADKMAQDIVDRLLRSLA